MNCRTQVTFRARLPSNDSRKALTGQFPVALEGAYNSGCIKLKDGTYAMAARVNCYSQKTTIWWLDSKDGG